MSPSRIFLFSMLFFIGGVAARSFIFIDNLYILLIIGIVSIFGFVSLNHKNEESSILCHPCEGEDPEEIEIPLDPRIREDDKRGRKMVYSLYTFSFLFGIFWYGFLEPTQLKLDAFAGQNINFQGKIIQEPEVKNENQQIIIAPDLVSKEKILVTAKRYPQFQYGDTVSIKGNLEKPNNFNDFDYVNYLAKDEIYFLVRFPGIRLIESSGFNLNHYLINLKNSLAQNINNFLPMPHSALANGMLFGSRSDIPKYLNDAFVSAGVSHILALSGYNITVIIMFISFLFSYLIVPEKIKLSLVFIIIVLFVIMTGASASIVRAAVMGSAIALAKYLGRMRQAFNILVFSAFLMILWQPKILVFDVSFQLSFVSLLGLIYILPYLEQKFRIVPEFLKIKESFLTSVSCQIAVLPIVLYNFHQASIIAPITNVLVGFLVPYIMLLGFIVGISGFFLTIGAQIFAFPLWVILTYQIGVIEYLANF